MKDIPKIVCLCLDKNEISDCLDKNNIDCGGGGEKELTK